MATIHEAFRDWYDNGPDETYWCDLCGTYHSDTEECSKSIELEFELAFPAVKFAEPVTINPADYAAPESLVEYEASIARSDEVSTLSLALEGSLISDDVVDAELWRATHTAD